MAASSCLDLKPDDNTWKWIKSHFFPWPLLARAARHSRVPPRLWREDGGLQILTLCPITLGTTGSAVTSCPQGTRVGASPVSQGVCMVDVIHSSASLLRG